MNLVKGLFDQLCARTWELTLTAALSVFSTFSATVVMEVAGRGLSGQPS